MYESKVKLNTLPVRGECTVVIENEIFLALTWTNLHPKKS